MHGSSTFLTTFALVLCTAAVTTVLFQRLKQPVILGYLLAGLVIGPHFTFIPISADHETTEILAEVGVILLLFGIGLEFSLRRLFRVGGSALITGVIAISLIFWVGNGAARLLGWNPTEALFAGAAMAVSSTTIIAKAFEDRGIGGKLRELVFGVLIIEDLFSILLLAGLSAVAAGQAASAGALGWTAFRLTALLLVTLLVGLFTIPRLLRWIIGLGSHETTLVAAVGLCFAGAYAAQAAGYSVALGAFLAGSLIAESGEGESVMHLVTPVRDIFAAVFFVSVGMLIDPGLVAEHWVAVLVITLVVVFGKVIAVSLGAFLAGFGTRMSLQAGMSMAQIGEFSFIIASVGMTSALVRDFLYPVMVAVSAVTTLITPWLIAGSPRAAAWFDRKLPRPLQSYAALYGSWLEELRAAPRERTMGQRVRRRVRWLLLDVACVAGIVIGASIYASRIGAWLTERFGFGETAVWALLIAGTVLAAAPFLFGVLRMSVALAQMLARTALPSTGKLDRAAAPRRALTITIEILILLLVTLPLLAVTQPFLPPFRGGAVLLVVVAVLAVGAWRSATNLEGHLSAGAQVLVAAVQSSLPPTNFTEEMTVPTLEGEADRFQTATHMLPGIGVPTPFRVLPEHHAVGKTLADLALRGRTGATVLAITRGGVGIPAPSKLERLEPGDTLVLVGSREAVDAAREVLVTG